MTRKDLTAYINKYLMPFVWEYNSNFKLDMRAEGYSFVYEDDNLILRINYVKFKGDYIHQNGCEITLKKVEAVMGDFLSQIGFELRRSFTTLVSIPLHDTEEYLILKRKGKEIKILSEEDFAAYASQQKEYLSGLVFPYFDKYGSLEGVSEALNLMTFDEILTYIDGANLAPFYKAMYITYRTGNLKRYTEIKEGVQKRLEDGESSGINLLPYWKGLHAMIKLLEG